MVELWRIKSEAKQLLSLYHFANIFLAASFVFTKLTPGLCTGLYGNGEEACAFNSREHEILVFFGVILVWKGRKASGLLHYLSNLYFYSKCVNSILFFVNNPLYGIAYSLLAIVCAVLLPEPAIADSAKITFFQGEALHRELERDKSVVWVIEFFTAWSAECRYIAPVFTNLSEKYTLKNLRFGKLDVGRYQKEGERFRINTHPLSKQLPSIAIFKGGVQANRRPAVGSNSRIIPFVFNEENCVIELELNELYEECKSKLGKYEKSKRE